MKTLIFIILFFSLPLLAHEAHHHHEDAEMSAGTPVPGASIYQLEGSWTKMNGEKMKLSSLRGEPRLVAMLYTRCQTACPLLVDDIQAIFKKIPETKKNMPVTLFSFDSDHETSETMQQFLSKRKLGKNWSVMKSDASTVTELAAALGVRFKKLPNGEYIHSNSVFLLDGEGVVIAQKDGLNTKDQKFVDEIKKLK
ncbi:MAG: hypothetical protein OM95_11235 [Bdellovibrio sp. ArHS]|uniref:SCO family protein n=1 Tax=Bdellovibrio sp. ArHS TaxID=1569284 RepID=UPI000582A62F|nr:SCO family protein [Bdellovibrio sp. ArHS]KHD88083.1 MAG: hypothetical protein OM95_11235 [Bdellovibrio sp. ArHS]